MNVSIVGSGYVGTTIAACLADIGHDVVNVEIDDEIVATINAGEAPIHESGLEQRIADHAGTNLRATTDYGAVRDTDVTFLCLPTPQSESGSLDLAIMRAGAESLGRALADKDGEHLVVVKSTVLPGTTEDVVGPILEAESGTEIGDGLELAMNPEFLRMGTAVEDFLEPDKVVLGTASEGLPRPSESCTRPFLRARRRTSSRRRSARPNSSSTRTTPFSRRRSRWSTNSGTSPGSTTRTHTRCSRRSGSTTGFRSDSCARDSAGAAPVSPRTSTRCAPALASRATIPNCSMRPSRSTTNSRGGSWPCSRSTSPSRGPNRGPRTLVQARDRRRAQVPCAGRDRAAPGSWRGNRRLRSGRDRKRSTRLSRDRVRGVGRKRARGAGGAVVATDWPEFDDLSFEGMARSVVVDGRRIEIDEESLEVYEGLTW